MQQHDNTLLAQILLRFDALYPMLVRQRLKDIGAGTSQDFISASNQVFRDRDGTQLAGTLTMLEKIKMISTLAKSEVATLGTNEIITELKNSLLPVVD